MKKTVNDKILWIVLAAIIIVLMVVGAMLDAWFSGDSNIQTVKVERIFLDVNEDGNVDLLLKGEVIFNDGPLAPTSKP